MRHEQTAQASLHPNHREHLLSEGFDECQIESWIESGDIESLSKDEAMARGFNVLDDDDCLAGSSGLYMRFSGEFGQLRCDNPPLRKGTSKPAKYLTPAGKSSVAMLPKGAKWITEGWKDAQAASTMGGVPVGAVAGVSHVIKAVPKGSGLSILFDADAWENPSVMLSLIQAAKHTGGKVQIGLEVEGEPKSGCCEVFNAGIDAVAFRRHLNKSMNLPQLLLKWAERLGETPDDKQGQALRWICREAAWGLKSAEQDKLRKKLKGSKCFSMPVIDSHMKHELRSIEKRKHKDDAKNRAGKGLKSALAYDPKELSQSTVAATLSDEWRGSLARVIPGSDWLEYGTEDDGLWTEVDRLGVKGRLVEELENRGCAGWFTDSFLNGTVGILESKLRVASWAENPNLIPFKNGVLDRDSGEFLSHSPGHRLLWQIPFNYDKSAQPGPILDWLRWTQDDDEHRLQQLRAVANMIIMGRTEWAAIPEIIGKPGTGKSTFCNILEVCLGSRSVKSSNLSEFENNRFELYLCRKARMLIFPDSDRFGGTPNNLKSWSGGDRLRGEGKSLNESFDYRPKGPAVLVGNEPIRFADNLGAMDRRLVKIFFNRAVPAGERRELIKLSADDVSGEFADYIPGFINWVITMPVYGPGGVKHYCTEEDAVPSLAASKIEAGIEASPIKQWIDDYLVVIPGNEAQVGDNNPEKADAWLYANYHQWCSRNNKRAVSPRDFSNALITALNAAGIPAAKGRNRTHSFISGIVLRGNDAKSPRPLSEQGEAPATQPSPEPEPDDVMPWDEVPMPTPAAESIPPQGHYIASDGSAYLNGEFKGKAESYIPSLSQKVAVEMMSHG